MITWKTKDGVTFAFVNGYKLMIHDDFWYRIGKRGALVLCANASSLEEAKDLTVAWATRH